MKTSTSLLAVSILLAASAITATASTEGPITTSTPISPTSTDWIDTLSFAQFNPALGTLDSVTLDFSSTLTTTLSVTNQDDLLDSKGYAVTELVINVQDTGSNLNANTLDLLSSHFNYSSLAPGDTATSGLLTKSQNDGGNIYTSSPILSEFTGFGNIILDAGTLTTTGVFYTGGSAAAIQASDANLTGTVTYTYTVPEPSTYALLFGGLGLLFLVHRTRRTAFRS